MQCQSFREAVSARLDGEPAGAPDLELDLHSVGCPDCARWERQAELVTRRVRVTPAPPVPDLTAAVLAALPPERVLRPAPAGRPGPVAPPGWWLRVALVVTGLVQALLAWPVAAADLGGMTGMQHVEHETGSWALAVAVAFFAVAARPRLAAGALPFLGSFAVLLAVLTFADLRAGHVDATRAVTHLLLLAGVALVGLLAWHGRRRPLVPAGPVGVPA
jgi:predicted anti-sigma-YlaC factor YlaD